MNNHTKLFASAFHKELLKSFPIIDLVSKVKQKKNTFTSKIVENEVTYICSWKQYIPYIDMQDINKEYLSYLKYVDSLVHKVYENDYIYNEKLQDDFLKYIRKEIGRYATTECKNTADILTKLSFLINTSEIADEHFRENINMAIHIWKIYQITEVDNYTDQPILISKEVKPNKQNKTITGAM